MRPNLPDALPRLSECMQSKGKQDVKNPRRKQAVTRKLANLRKGRLQGRPPLLDSFDMEGVASYIQSGVHGAAAWLRCIWDLLSASPA